MRIVQVQLNCTTEREYYRILGVLIVVQKLLNDYMASRYEDGVGPEGFAEDWIENLGIEGPIKDYIVGTFNSALLAISRSENL